jgi:DNA-binding NtrC family response regulator
MAYEYPGNVRELENIIEHAFVLCKGGLIEMDHLPPELRRDNQPKMDGFRSPTTIRSMEKLLIEETLRRHGGNRKKTAMYLGIDTSTLYRKIQSLQIEKPLADGRR